MDAVAVAARAWPASRLLPCLLLLCPRTYPALCSTSNAPPSSLPHLWNTQPFPPCSWVQMIDELHAQKDLRKNHWHQCYLAVVLDGEQRREPCVWRC